MAPPVDQSTLEHVAICDAPYDRNSPRPFNLEPGEKPKITIRNARRSDLDAIVSIGATAFWNEDCHGRFLHPFRKAFPDSVIGFWRRNIREALVDKANHLIIVAVADCDPEPIREHREGEIESVTLLSNPLPRVIAFADLSFVGSPRPKMFQNDPWYSIRKLIIIPLVRLYNYIDEYFCPNKALDLSRGDPGAALKDAIELYTKPDPEEKRKFHPAYMYLNLLAVHPNFERKFGVGSQLTQRCKEIAKDDESLPLGLVCAGGTLDFYRKNGVDVYYGNITTDTKDGPLSGIAGGEMVFTE